MDQPTKYWRCQDCDEISVESSLLTAPSPFDPRQTITGCPTAKAPKASIRSAMSRAAGGKRTAA